MKRRFWLVPVLLLVPLIGVSLRAREKASWQDQRISRAQFAALIMPTARPKSAKPTLFPRPLQQLAQTGGWQVRAVSPAGSRLLVEGAHQRAALLDARDGRLVADLFTVYGRGWQDEQFSPDGGVVAVPQPAAGSAWFFAASTGELLWSTSAHADSEFRFSSDGQFTAHLAGFHSRAGRVVVFETATGRKLMGEFIIRCDPGQSNFSREGDFFLAATDDGDFLQFRLR